MFVIIIIIVLILIIIVKLLLLLSSALSLSLLLKVYLLDHSSPYRPIALSLCISLPLSLHGHLPGPGHVFV